MRKTNKLNQQHKNSWEDLGKEMLGEDRCGGRSVTEEKGMQRK